MGLVRTETLLLLDGLAVDDLIPLQFLSPGDRARVGCVCGDSQFVHRLRELGFCDGAEVEMVRRGEACIVRLGNHTFGLRSDELTTILVRPLPARNCA